MNYPESIRAAEQRVASVLLGNITPADFTSEFLFMDLEIAQYNLPFVGVEDIRMLIDNVHGAGRGTRPLRTYLPGLATVCRIRSASRLIDHAMDVYDDVTALSAAQYIDAVHPMSRATGRRYQEASLMGDLTSELYDMNGEWN